MAKVKIKGICSRAEFESKIDQCAQLETAMHVLEAELNQKVLNLKEKYGENIKAHAKLIEKLTAECAQFASANTQELFGKGRSSETPLARFGFRTGQPTVKKVVKKNESELIEELLGEDKDSPYVARKFSLDKEAIRSGIEAGIEYLKKLFAVTQDEVFYINPKTDENQ